jgi:poly-gamma-glutamate system protein
MKPIYWRPSHVPWTALVAVATLAVTGLGAVEHFTGAPDERSLQTMLEASRLAADGMDVIREERLARRLDVDPAADPTGSGLIGDPMTPTTSNSGDLVAKQTSVNPNFAAVVVQMLRDAGVEEGDTVAAGFSGSFPALNLAVLAAAEVLDLRLVVVSSASASQWGANHPRLLWIDMERALSERGLLETRSVAVSLGGLEDRALGMSPRGRRLLRRAIARNELPLLDVESFEDSVRQRMRVYERAAGDEPIAAYVNVGGATASVGHHTKYEFSPGVNRDLPAAAVGVDSVMARFVEQGVPAIHLVNVARIATAYGLPIAPQTVPDPGDGGVYQQGRYDPWLIVLVLGLIVGSCFLFLRSPRGLLLFWSARRRKDDLRPSV